MVWLAIDHRCFHRILSIVIHDKIENDPSCIAGLSGLWWYAQWHLLVRPATAQLLNTPYSVSQTAIRKSDVPWRIHLTLTNTIDQLLSDDTDS